LVRGGLDVAGWRLVRIAIALVLALSSPAIAEVRAGVHMAGGLEGGLITGAAHPGGVAEAGMSLEALIPGWSWGGGFSIESVGRTSSQFMSAEEIKIDATWRWASKNRKVRGGVGGGLRVLTFGEGAAARSVSGIDLTRIDASMEGAHWQVGSARVAVDFYVAWTFGCYSDTYTAMPVGDMKPRTIDVRCGETITTAYVFGLKTTVGWR